jgi:GntR family transcriptional regulator
VSEPIYVTVSGEYARRIRCGELPPGTQLPSLSEMAEQHEVSDIVARKAVELLQSQGLVRSVRRRGNFVADQPNLLRVSPEQECAVRSTLDDESDDDLRVERDTQ